MLRVFLDRVVPDAYRIQPRDILLAVVMHKYFSIPVLTTREHETSYSIHYRNLCIVGPDPKYNTDRTFAEESEERLRVHYMYLKSILSTHPDSTIREWTQSDVVSWLKVAKIKKRSKKVVTCNVQSPPHPLIIHVPFEVLWVIINDAFCESPHATIHSALGADITGAHVVEVFQEKDGWRVWDQAPSGTWEKVVTPPPDGEVFRTDQRPTYNAHRVLWGIEFLLASAPKPSSEGAAKRQRRTILGAWLQAKGEG